MKACKLLVIIAETALERQLGEDVMRLGASGYTVCDVRGQGRHHERGAQWDADRSMRMEVLCNAHTAELIAEYAKSHYFQHYAIVLHCSDAEVMRPEKFTG